MNTDRNISPRSEVDVTNTDTHVTECLHHRINPVWLLHGQMYLHHGHIDIDIDYILYISYKHKLYQHKDMNIVRILIHSSWRIISREYNMPYLDNPMLYYPCY